MESIKELRKICQSPKEIHNPESFLDQKLWRSFSIYITKLLLYTGIKPDHVTFFMVFWGFIVGFLFSIGTYQYMLIGAIALEFFMVLDAIDGEIARYRKMFSMRGIFLDLVAHATNTACPFIGLTIGFYRYNPNVYIILAGLSASVFSILCFNIQAMKYYVIFKKLLEHSRKARQIKSVKINQKITQDYTKGSILKLIGKLINYLYDHTYMLQIILLTAIFGQLYWLLIFYGLTFPFIWLVKLVYEYKIDYKPYEYLLEPYKR